MRKSFFIYKYIKDDEVIYVGKTKRSLNERINEHKKDLPLDAEVWFCECQSEADMNIIELFLIDKYRPKYNRDCISRRERTSISFKEPQWKPASLYLSPVRIFKEYIYDAGLYAIYINGDTGKEEKKKVQYCDCPMDFPVGLSFDSYSYKYCRECGRIIKGTFKTADSTEKERKYPKFDLMSEKML